MSSSRMCWTMCITISCSPSTSIGETRAAMIASSPQANSAMRPNPGGCRSPGVRAAPPPPEVDGRRDEHAEQHSGLE